MSTDLTFAKIAYRIHEYGGVAPRCDLNRLKTLAEKTTDAKVQKQWLSLQIHILAFQYRIDQANQEPDPTDLEKLQTKVLQWKNETFIVEDKELTSFDLEQIENACRYRKFVPLLLKHPALFTKFVLWAIRNRAPVAPFFEFPTAVKKMIKSDLHQRFSFCGSHLLKIKTFDGKRKDLTFLMLGKEVSLLNSQEKIDFGNNMVMTVDQVIQEFARKNIFYADLECGEDGIQNWNYGHMGPFDPETQKYHHISLEEPNWWANLPVILTLDLKGVQERYKNASFDGKSHLVVPSATQSFPGPTTAKSHAFLEIAYRVGDNEFRILPFGKMAQSYPETCSQELGFLTKPSLGHIIYPDINAFYTQRKRLFATPIEVDNEALAKVMHEIKTDIQKAREGNIVFNIMAENCAEWVQRVLDSSLGSLVPQYFKRTLSTSIHAEPLNCVFQTLHNLQENARTSFSRSFYKKIDNLAWIILGAWRNLRTPDGQLHGFMQGEFWQNRTLHVPSSLGNR
jgi:hypothetical protein